MMTGRSHSYLASNDVVAPFDFPFSIENSVWDMNAKGEVVGYYTDTAKKVHGFLLRLDDSVMTSGVKSEMGLNGSFAFTTIDYPGATATRAVGINSTAMWSGPMWTRRARHTHSSWNRGGIIETSSTPNVYILREVVQPVSNLGALIRAMIHHMHSE